MVGREDDNRVKGGFFVWERACVAEARGRGGVQQNIPGQVNSTTRWTNERGIYIASLYSFAPHSLFLAVFCSINFFATRW